MFARFQFYGVSLLGYSRNEFWCMRAGEYFDQWECYRQYHGMSRPYRECFIEEVI